MNYRHAYHAGNFADVHKHAALTLLLGHLLKKDTAFHLIDSHAGIGRYDLSGVEAGKTGEYAGGIAKVIGQDDPLLQPYLAAVAAQNDGPLRFYPGSPLIARHLLRPQDRMTLVELHPEDAQTLRGCFQRDRQVTIREEDGYQAVKALLPPKERRGLVLIDPPYEVRDEFPRMIRGLSEALKRWQTGIFALWYPIKSPAEIAKFHAELTQWGRPCFVSELMLQDPADDTKLNGSGMALLNPPWQLDEQMDKQLALLHSCLDCRGTSRLRWLVTG